MTGAGRIYRLIDEAGELLYGEQHSAAWADGLTTTLEAIPATTPTLVLADTPYLKTNPANCLEKDPSDLVDCSTARSDAIDASFDAAERAAAEAAGATYADLNELVCPYSPCPVVFDDVFAWRNRDHLTASFVKGLAPSVGRAVSEALARGQDEADQAAQPEVSAQPEQVNEQTGETETEG